MSHIYYYPASRGPRPDYSIDPERYEVDTVEQIAAVRAELAGRQDPGLHSYPVSVGEDDNEIKTGQVVWIDSAEVS